MDDGSVKDSAGLLPPLCLEADDLSPLEVEELRATRDRLVAEFRDGVDSRRSEGMAELAQQLGDCELSLGMRDEALKSYRRASHLLGEDDPIALRAATHYAIAEIERSRGQWGEAEAGYVEAARLFAETDDKGAGATCWLCAGKMRAQVKQDAGAVDAYRRAGDIFESIGDQLGRAHSLFRSAESMRFSEAAASVANFSAAGDFYQRLAGDDGETPPVVDSTDVEEDVVGGEAEAPPDDLRLASPALMARLCKREVEKPEAAVIESASERGIFGFGSGLANPQDQKRLTNLIILSVSMLLFALGYQLNSMSGEIPSPVVEANRAARKMPTVVPAAARADVLRLKASEAVSRGEIQVAKGLYRDALGFYEKLKSNGPQADVVMALAQMEKGDGARVLYERARGLYETMGDRKGELKALDALKEIDEASGNLVGLAYGYGRRVEILEIEGEGETLTEALRVLGDLQRQKRDTAGVRVTLLKLLAVHEKSGATHAIAQTLERLAALDLRAGDHRKAKIRFERAYALHRENRSNAGQARALIALGDVEFAIKNPRQARASYRQALDLVKAESKIRGHALLRMGDTEAVLGHQSRAAEFFRQALEACDEAGDQKCRDQVDRRLNKAG